MVTAPVAFVVLTVTTDPRVTHILVATPTGWACLSLGVVLDAVGAVWMAHMARRVA
jgi:Flp pilus assembly protein TadB